MLNVKICTSIVAKDLDSLVRFMEYALSSGSDIVELRLDHLTHIDVDLLNKRIEKFLDKVIIAIRPPYEGGLYTGSEKDRFLILSSLIDAMPAYVDVELRSPYVNELVDRARKKGIDFIISWHDFSGTPDVDYLRRAVDNILEAGGYAKVITHARTIDDNVKVLSLYEHYVSNRLIAFCMGEKGIISRFLSIVLGCPIIYSCLEGMPAAPGQPPLDLVKKLVELLSKSKIKVAKA